MFDFAKQGAHRWMCVAMTIVAALMSFVSCVAADDDSDAVLDQFRKEAPSAWEEHRLLTALVGGAWTTVAHYSAKAGAKPRDDIIREEIKLGTGGGVVVHSSDINKDGKSTLMAMGYNPRYAFELKSDNPEGPWVLQKLAMNTEPAWDRAREILAPPNFMLTAIGGRSIPLSDYVQDDGTEVDLQRVEGDLVTFVFHREESRDEKSARWPTEAEVTLNRAQKWTTKRWRVVFANGQVSEMDISARIVDGVPILQRRVARDFGLQQRRTEPVAEGVEEFDLQYPAPPIPMSEFTLSAFGLPEPPDRSGSRWFLYAGSAGILLLAFGFWLRSRRKA